MAKKLVLNGGKDEGKQAGDFLAAVFRKFSEQVETKSEAALLKSALQVENTSKLLMRPITATSESGAPPRVDTGRLRSSITHRLRRNGANVMIAEVGTNVEYAADLEYGTSQTWKHPFLHPALDKNVQLIIKIERDAVRSAANAVKS